MILTSSGLLDRIEFSRIDATRKLDMKVDPKMDNFLLHR